MSTPHAFVFLAEMKYSAGGRARFTLLWSQVREGKSRQTVEKTIPMVLPTTPTYDVQPELVRGLTKYKALMVVSLEAGLNAKVPGSYVHTSRSQRSVVNSDLEESMDHDACKQDCPFDANGILPRIHRQAPLGTLADNHIVTLMDHGEPSESISDPEPR